MMTERSRKYPGLPYFAYGSNMCMQRLLARAPSAKPLGKGSLHQYELRFHKESIDGSAKCDAFHTSDVRNIIHGVLFDLSESDQQVLDVYEGLGQGYERKSVLVKCESGDIQAYTYCATWINPALKPYDWYKGLVLCGALQQGLPISYIERIKQIESMPDPDQTRYNTNMSLLISAGYIQGY